MKAHKGRLEGTTISVDNFRPDGTITHYFLTHGHSDHCTGLTPTWNYSVIYTTTITKKFILSKYKMEPNIFIELTVGERRIMPLVHDIYAENKNKNKNKKTNKRKSSQGKDEDDIPTLSFAVTPIDANHCPGAVCYLFEGYFGKFLCTGDFRYKQGLFDQYDNIINCDRLYLDDTYCSPYYSHFLTDTECANEIKNIINLPENDNCKFLIAVDTLGKEPIFIQLSKLLKTLIVVAPPRYKRLKDLIDFDPDSHERINISQYFTTDPENGFIFMVNKREISLRNLDRKNEKFFKIRDFESGKSSQLTQYTQGKGWDDDMAKYKYEWVGILPSGWSINKNPLKTSAEGSRCYSVTYSAHSSYEELCDAVRYIRPKFVIPIVNDRYVL